MESLEVTGRTVDEAVEKALSQLGVSRSEVEVEVVSPGRPGILGIGAEPARVVVHLRSEAPVPAAAAGPAEPAGEGAPDSVAAAKGVLEDLLRLMGVEATVTVREPETPGDGVGMAAAVLDIHGEDLGILIGRRGETMASLQYLVNLMVSKRVKGSQPVSIDVEGYRRRREESLRNLAVRMAERVRRSGRSVTLEPMPANERRIVHLALAQDPDVVTVSIGEGESRKVAITPRR
ncbi:MAG TPA: RNA-binding cell elongation regulator Jag/EloR [Dehalococcoidia bacterium]